MLILQQDTRNGQLARQPKFLVLLMRKRSTGTVGLKGAPLDILIAGAVGSEHKVTHGKDVSTPVLTILIIVLVEMGGRHHEVLVFSQQPFMFVQRLLDILARRN
jgi:hypothetical protein